MFSIMESIAIFTGVTYLGNSGFSPLLRPSLNSIDDGVFRPTPTFFIEVFPDAYRGGYIVIFNGVTGSTCCGGESYFIFAYFGQG